MSSVFERWLEEWDPDGGVNRDYTFEIKCGAGVTIASALVDMVNEASDAVDATSNVSVTAIATGAIDSLTQGVTWIPVRISPTVEIPPIVYVRCRYVLSNGKGDDFTMRLYVQQK